MRGPLRGGGPHLILAPSQLGSTGAGEASRRASRESLLGGGFFRLLVLALEFGLAADVDEEKRHPAEGKKDDASEQNTEDTAHGERVVRVERDSSTSSE